MILDSDLDYFSLATFLPIHLNIQQLALPISLEAHTRILMASARYKTLDSMLGILVVVSLQNYAHITVLSPGSPNLCGVPGWKSYAVPSLQKLIEMADGSRRQGRMGECVVVELMARANEMLMEIHPSL
jgi:hypothetical protein